MRRNLWVGRCVFFWWPLFPPRNYVLICIFLYLGIFHTNSGYNVYIYIYICTGSVVKYCWSCTPHHSLYDLLGVRGSCVECHLLFSLVSTIVSCSITNRLILWCLWPLVFVLNNIVTLGILRSAICHLPGCFLFNWLSLRGLVSWINHLPPVRLSTFLNRLLNNSWAVGVA